MVADHEMSDLEEVLDEAIQVDFNVQAEDDSPYMVARSLVNMYNQVAHGDVSYVETLRQQYISQQQNNTVLANSMKDPSNTHGMGEDDDSDSSSGSDESDMDVDMEDAPRNEPIVDEDGFQVVQSRRGNRRQQ
jgi:pre-rRNA-processing protein TSR2